MLQAMSLERSQPHGLLFVGHRSNRQHQLCCRFQLQDPTKPKVVNQVIKSEKPLGLKPQKLLASLQCSLCHPDHHGDTSAIPKSPGGAARVAGVCSPGPPCVPGALPPPSSSSCSHSPAWPLSQLEGTGQRCQRIHQAAFYLCLLQSASQPWKTGRERTRGASVLDKSTGLVKLST